jgi:DNA-directed RNA polymerase specialized sigma24 family protein
MPIVAKPQAELVSGIRWFARRELGDRFSEAIVEDICLEVTESTGEDPAEHRAEILAIVRRHIQQCQAGRDIPEASIVVDRQNLDAAKNVLGSLKAREREALTMFYCDGMTPEAASARAKMSTGQFTDLRRRTRELFAEHRT